MKLRTRLFIWVGGLFAIAFGASFVLEDHVTRKSLEKSYDDLLVQLQKRNEKRRLSIEEYLADLLWHIQGKVDAILRSVATLPLIQEGFQATPVHLEDGTWLDAASLMVTHKWIDYVQNVHNGKLLSEILIESDYLNRMRHFEISENLSLIAIQDLHDPDHWMGPYVGLPFQIHHFEERAGGSFDKPNETYFVIMTPESVVNYSHPENPRNLDLSINLIEPFLKWIELTGTPFFMEQIVGEIDAAKGYIEQNPDVFSKEHFEEVMRGAPPDPAHCYEEHYSREEVGQ